MSKFARLHLGGWTKSEEKKSSEMELKSEQGDIERIAEIHLQGKPQIKQMLSNQTDDFYHCYYYYFEDQVGQRPMIKKEEGWYYPDLQKYISELQEKWGAANIPLNIFIENKKIKIVHKFPSEIGIVAQLKLSPYLAYMFGYRDSVSKQGQYLRFDENGEYMAPLEPKMFLSYCDTIDKEKLKLKFASQLNAIKQELETEYNLAVFDIKEKWKFYFETRNTEIEQELKLEYETKMKDMQLDIEKRLKKECSTQVDEKKLELNDCRDREENYITPIKDLFKVYDKMWVIKGEVLGGQMTSMGFDANTIKKMFVMEVKDYTGNLKITALERNAELLSGLTVKGMEYYISNSYDQNDMSASINNNLFKIKFDNVL